MRSYVEHALRSRPPVPRPRDRWEEIQRIGRLACEKLPLLADTSTRDWSHVLHITSALEQEAAVQLRAALESCKIRTDIRDGILMVWTSDLIQESHRRRAEADASFMEMMRAR